MVQISHVPFIKKHAQCVSYIKLICSVSESVKGWRTESTFIWFRLFCSLLKFFVQVLLYAVLLFKVEGWIGKEGL